MDYYCENCDIFIKPKSKNEHFKSKTQEYFNKCKHRKISIGNLNINDMEEIFFFASIIDYKKIMFIILWKASLN